MQSDIEIFPIFPSSFCTIMLPEMVAKFWEEETPNIKFFLPDEDASVWQTERDVLDNYLEMKELFRQIAEDCLKELGYNQKFINKLFIESAWFNVGKKGDSLIKHIHPGSLLSGAFYLSCDSEEDQILFFGDDDMILPPQNFNDLSAKYAAYKCIPGSILLFKSNINHCTNSQKSNEKITISFNLNYNKN